MILPNNDASLEEPGIGSECERCGESLLGTIRAEVIARGDTEPIVIHEACVDPTDTVLRLVHDDESTNYKD